MSNLKHTGAYRYAVLAFEDFAKESPSKIEQYSLLSELCKIAGFDSDPLLEYLNKEFDKLLEKHEYDTKYDYKKDYGWDPDDESYFATIVNAYEELMSYNPTFSELFDYMFGDGNNKWDVGIVRK